MSETMDTQQAYSALPSVDRLLRAGELSAELDEVGHEPLKTLINEQLEKARRSIAQGDVATLQRLQEGSFQDQLLRDIKAAVQDRQRGRCSGAVPTLRPVLNLTGTVVHTNLGRASLAETAIQAMAIAAGGATNLEFDLDAGERGDRDSHLEKLLCGLTGAEAATVVNNNAAAVMLVLNSLAKEREVLISRGELVEIGGAFRIPDVMASASAILREVGTTNRTHGSDFEQAIGKNTAMLMKVHTSNYEVRGFTACVPDAELAAIARRAQIPYVSDLGSGTLIDLERWGLPHEPTVQEALASGADLVTFSGDKLLGGPQAGIIVGRADLIAACKRNPLKRALRTDKVTLAGLLETVRLYQDPQRLADRLPILRDLTRSAEDIAGLARELLGPVRQILGGKVLLEVVECRSQIGSGALPLDLLPSSALALRPLAEKGQRDARLVELAALLRGLPMPIIGRLHDGALLLDLRCLQSAEELLTALAQLELSWE
jgi:L-seryl-tRNA(Ser) seleniumtransferase